MKREFARCGGALVIVLASGVCGGVGAETSQAATLGDTPGHMGINAADPSVIRTEDGYVGIESRGGRALFVRVAPRLAELAETKASRIWSDRNRLGDVWAPEIVFRNNRYEVYFAAGFGSAHRMYVIGSDKPAADYGEARQIELPDDKWAIDGVPFTYEGEDNFIWSGWQGDTDVRQDIYIARIGAGGAVQSPRVMISSPDQKWENIAGESPSINEGPQPIVDPAGRLHVVYSANGSWGENYCLADLRMGEGADPLDANDWHKSDGCLFGANSATLAPDGTLTNEAKGVGHHSFALSNGGADYPSELIDAAPFLYHGVPAEEEPSNFWSARKWYLGTFQWVPDVAYSDGDVGWSMKFAE